MRPRLVCASANPDKVTEIRAVLGDLVELVDRPASLGEVVEDGDTLEANSLLKARAVCAASGLPAVADDTGLFVDALDGRPGVYSSRYAGEHASYAENRAKLLGELDGVRDRRARFATAAVVVWPSGEELVVSGVCEGMISTREIGTRGFGYDSVFVPDEGGGRTFSQLSEGEKNAISHRGRALRALVEALSARGAR